MKRCSNPFSVDIKKSRRPNQHHQRLPKFQLETSLADVTHVSWKKAPQAMVEPSGVPRILPSIVEHVWSNPEPIEPVRNTRSSVAIAWRQMKFDEDAGSVEDVQDLTTELTVLKAASQTAIAVSDQTTIPIQNDQSVQNGSVTSNERTLRRKFPKSIESMIASGSETEPEPASPPSVCKARSRPAHADRPDVRLLQLKSCATSAGNGVFTRLLGKSTCDGDVTVTISRQLTA